MYATAIGSAGGDALAPPPSVRADGAWTLISADGAAVSGGARNTWLDSSLALGPAPEREVHLAYAEHRAGHPTLVAGGVGTARHHASSGPADGWRPPEAGRGDRPVAIANPAADVEGLLRLHAGTPPLSPILWLTGAVGFMLGWLALAICLLPRFSCGDPVPGRERKAS
jgi:hypothetical protein